MTITADRLLDSLKKTTTDPELRAFLAELGVSQEGAELKDGFGEKVTVGIQWTLVR